MQNFSITKVILNEWLDFGIFSSFHQYEDCIVNTVKCLNFFLISFLPMTDTSIMHSFPYVCMASRFSMFDVRYTRARLFLHRFHFLFFLCCRSLRSQHLFRISTSSTCAVLSAMNLFKID